MLTMRYVVDWIDICLYRINRKRIHIQSVPNFSFRTFVDQFSNLINQRLTGVDQRLNN